MSPQRGEESLPQLVDKQYEHMFLDLAEQDEQAILLSDPNFLRQQQLLQNQQKAKEIRMEQERQRQEDLEASSAWLAHPATLDQSENDGAIPAGRKPDDYLPVDCSFPNTTISTSAPARSRVHPPTPAKGTIYKSPSKRDSIRRSQTININGRRSGPKPIPISSGNNTTNLSAVNSASTKVDHQRRFNELQARFRVNYAHRPSQQKTQVTPSVSTSYSGRSVIDQPKKLVSSFGTSMPSSLEQTLRSYPSINAERKRSFDEARNASHHPGGKATAINSTTGNISLGMNQASTFPSRTMPIQIKRVHRDSTPHPLDAEEYQRKLDDQLIKVNFDDITVSELKDMLRQRGKPAMGKKAILLQRLQEERDQITNARYRDIYTQGQMSIHCQSEPPQRLSRQGALYRIGSIPESSSTDSARSSVMLSNSLGSTFSLNRSIADMHIGSPQYTHSFSPHAATSSPPNESSPIPQPGSLSSSLSFSFMSSPPSNYESSISSMLSSGSSFSSRARYAIPNTGIDKHKPYAPFTSSSLASPDYDDDDRSPFDGSRQFMTDMENIEWVDPSSQPLLH
ncbi:hypothetical protein EC973_006586 [Apophysomyces ossiformis]|uniref:SAP domain-containing protein n=1 Tax=Apophysomyces ossiformis TaxID=679940 RepID=A0A8H7BR10_9FUNG|nr:hypothetical protein EC973_006586 [Apophysomyces ossiformis]